MLGLRDSEVSYAFNVVAIICDICKQWWPVLFLCLDFFEFKAGTFIVRAIGYFSNLGAIKGALASSLGPRLLSPMEALTYTI